jgi:hypothetical protein
LGFGLSTGCFEQWQELPYGFGWRVREIAGRMVYDHSRSWQEFKTDIIRHQDDDLTVIALANLAQADPERFCSGITKIVAPHLVPARVPAPATGSNPASIAQLERVLAATAQSALDTSRFAYNAAGFIADQKRYGEVLRVLGPPLQMTLTAREELGDDVVSTYQVEFREEALEVVFGTAPDGKISQLSIRRKSQP